jgi:hypothetical protein
VIENHGIEGAIYALAASKDCRFTMPRTADFSVRQLHVRKVHFVSAVDLPLQGGTEFAIVFSSQPR